MIRFKLSLFYILFMNSRNVAPGNAADSFFGEGGVVQAEQPPTERADLARNEALILTTNLVSLHTPNSPDQQSQQPNEPQEHEQAMWDRYNVGQQEWLSFATYIQENPQQYLQIADNAIQFEGDAGGFRTHLQQLNIDDQALRVFAAIQRDVAEARRVQLGAEGIRNENSELAAENLEDAQEDSQATAVMMAARERAVERYLRNNNISDDTIERIMHDENLSIFCRLGEMSLLGKIMRDNGVTLDESEYRRTLLEDSQVVRQIAINAGVEDSVVDRALRDATVSQIPSDFSESAFGYDGIHELTEQQIAQMNNVAHILQLLLLVGRMENRNIFSNNQNSEEEEDGNQTADVRNEMSDSLRRRRELLVGRLAQLIGQTDNGARLSEPQRTAAARRIDESVRAGRISQEPTVTSTSLNDSMNPKSEQEDHVNMVMHSVPHRTARFGNNSFADPDGELGRYFAPA